MVVIGALTSCLPLTLLTHSLTHCQDRSGVIVVYMIYGLSNLGAISVAIGTLAFLGLSHTAHCLPPSYLLSTLRPSLARSLSHSPSHGQERSDVIATYMICRLSNLGSNQCGHRGPNIPGAFSDCTLPLSLLPSHPSVLLSLTHSLSYFLAARSGQV